MGKRRTGPGARDGGQQGGAGGGQGVGRGDKLGTAQICQCLRGERQGPEPPGPARGPGSWYTRLCPLSQAHVPAGLPCQLLASFSHKAGSPWRALRNALKSPGSGMIN